MERILGKKSVAFSYEQLHAAMAACTRVHVDLGAGDGAWAWRQAATQPNTLFLGIDAARENLAGYAARSIRRPTKGGRPNLIFLAASWESLAESIPPPLCHAVDSISIWYPWGSLLEAAVDPTSPWLSLLARWARPNTRLEMALNLSIFADRPYAQRLALPDLDEEWLETVLLPRYVMAGWIHKSRRRWGAGEPPVPTTWGRRLARGSGRETLWIRWDRDTAPGASGRER